MESVIQFFEYFLTLSEESKKLILECVQLKKIKKNTVIVEEGQKNKHMYIIKKGVVCGIKNIEGAPKIVNIWMENETFGDVATYINDDVATKSFTALENLEVYMVDTKKFRDLFNTSIEICNLGRIIAEKYIIKTEFLHSVYYKKSASERLDFFENTKPGLINRIPLKTIASYLDITPETVSRLRKNRLEK